MWNRALAARARHYPSGVLTVVEASGYPSSVRCQAVFDDATELIRLPAVSPIAVGWRGQACLLFHRHNARLEEQYELLITGDLAEEAGGIVLRPRSFVTGTGSPKNDRMPHAGAPLDLIRFMLLGRRKARAYLAKRGKAWPRVDFEAMLRELDAQ